MPSDASRTPDQLDDEVEHPFGELEWSRWPARERPLLTLLLLAIAAAASVAAGAVTSSPACALLALVLLLLTMANHLLPTHCSMSGDGVSVRGLGRSRLLKWSRIDAARVGQQDAVLLYTTEHSADQRQFRIDLGPRPEGVAKALRQRLLDAGVPLV